MVGESQALGAGKPPQSLALQLGSPEVRTELRSLGGGFLKVGGKLMLCFGLIWLRGMQGSQR